MDGQDFDAKGQRQFVKYGNETITRFLYDANTFRLSNLLTMSSDDTTSLQDLDYTYDPVGNITEVRDNAQQTYYYSNQIVIAEKKYSYDAQYRLKSATGREHISLGVLGSDIPSHQDLTHLPGMPPASHLGAVCRYTQTYQYDKADNILMMKHVRDTGGGWTRGYKYNSITDASNKLLSTKVNGWTSNYHYDYSGNALDNTHGNMTKMPHLQALNWNFQDQLQSVELLGGVGTAYYNYDASGQRVRKVVVKSNSREERLYLGGVERYREYSTSTGTNVTLERWTLQVEGIAQVDTLTMDSGSAVTSPVPAIRYQYKDHLGSATLETNELGEVISYEEYHPFGSSAYRVEKSGTNLSLKRYRFTNKERDDETGLYYFGVRYYAAWLGRWSSSDPGGGVDGLNLYWYGGNNPVVLVDEEGYAAEPPPENSANKENQNPPHYGDAYHFFFDYSWALDGKGNSTLNVNAWYSIDKDVNENGLSTFFVHDDYNNPNTIIGGPIGGEQVTQFYPFDEYGLPDSRYATRSKGVPFSSGGASDYAYLGRMAQLYPELQDKQGWKEAMVNAGSVYFGEEKVIKPAETIYNLAAIGQGVMILKTGAANLFSKAANKFSKPTPNVKGNVVHDEFISSNSVNSVAITKKAFNFKIADATEDQLGALDHAMKKHGSELSALIDKPIHWTSQTKLQPMLDNFNEAVDLIYTEGMLVGQRNVPFQVKGASSGSVSTLANVYKYEHKNGSIYYLHKRASDGRFISAGYDKFQTMTNKFY